MAKSRTATMKPRPKRIEADDKETLGDAANRAFLIYELVEIIVLNLPRNQILVLQRLNSTCLSVVAGSLAVRKKLFLEYAPAEDNADLLGKSSHVSYRWGCPSESPLQGPCPHRVAAWNRIGGLPNFVPSDIYVPRIACTERLYRIKFASKTEAKAVLAANRASFSWENMYPDSATPSRVQIEVHYLQTTTINMGEGSGSTEWLVDQLAIVIVENPTRPLKLGEICKIAARIVLRDEQAWTKPKAIAKRYPESWDRPGPRDEFRALEFPMVDADENIELDISDIMPITRIKSSDKQELEALSKTTPHNQHTARKIRASLSSWLNRSLNTRRGLSDNEIDSLTGRYRVSSASPGHERAERGRLARKEAKALHRESVADSTTLLLGDDRREEATYEVRAGRLVAILRVIHAQQSARLLIE